MGIDFDDLEDEIEETDVDEELADIAERETALAIGLDGELKTSFETAHTTESKSETTTVDTVGSRLYGRELPVNHDLANKLLKRVYRELNEAPEPIPEDVILGAPQYALLEPWARETHDSSIEAVLPVDEVRVVPGPMVHAGRQKDQLFTEYIERNMDE